MNLGAFSVSLAVKDLQKSKDFYEKLGFEPFGGHAEQGWLIMKNGEHLLGLFQGMFEKNILTSGNTDLLAPSGRRRFSRKARRSERALVVPKKRATTQACGKIGPFHSDCARKPAMRRCSSLIEAHSISLLAPCLAGFLAAT